ncbi:hypothetical protein PR202_ga00068 [Eleusine coracana subsp. coracana]|uniref:DUF3615 domain-containing protein n=1 Tax=Eleusine coracana subsp. coracana TaxID=191504 RepID=A0AAV5BAU3_ELECO|nr:hypothetical protein PR202_ga00068 [Eleusine coracana subsp. coracana]
MSPSWRARLLRAGLKAELCLARGQGAGPLRAGVRQGATMADLVLSRKWRARARASSSGAPSHAGEGGEFPKPVLDEHAKEVLAQRSRQEELLRQEELQWRQRIKAEVKKRREQFPPGKAPPDRQLRKEVVGEDRLARVEERHVRNVQMAIRVINRRHPDSKYELREITAKSTIYECGSAYCHYNFNVYSPTDGYQFYFAEVYIDTETEDDVYQCCVLGRFCLPGAILLGQALTLGGERTSIFLSLGGCSGFGFGAVETLLLGSALVQELLALILGESHEVR